VGFL
jgi:hypothetical protein